MVRGTVNPNTSSSLCRGIPWCHSWRAAPVRTRRERVKRWMRKQSPLEGLLKNIVVSDWEAKMDTGSASKGSSLW